MEDSKIGLPAIWAIGVGSVLGGDFFGWQFITYGGVFPAFVSVIIAAVFYWIYAGAITELAARYRTTGGSFDFVRKALGEKHATAMAILGLLKLILANAALALAISSYLLQAGMPRYLQFVCWLTTYGLFTILDSIGVKQSASVQFFATALCLLILAFYSLSSLTQFDPNNLTAKENIARDGILGFLKGLPFSLQFFDGFEETPLLMEYAHEPNVTIPKAIAASYVSITIVAFLILFAGCGISNIDTLLHSEAPLMEGIKSVYGDGVLADIIDVLIVLGLLVNFFAFVLFCSQQIQAVAEAGHLPSSLAYRHPVHGAPVIASVASSCVGITLCVVFSLLFNEAQAQNTLVTAALMPAVLGYALLLECIAKIRHIEEKQYPGSLEKLSSQETTILGNDPEEQLRFAYGKKVVRFAQGLCGLFFVGLCALASVAMDFLYGVVIIVVFAMLLYLLMNHYHRQNTTNMQWHFLNALDDSPDNRSGYMQATDEDDDVVVVPMHGGGNISNTKIRNFVELKRHNDDAEL